VAGVKRAIVRLLRTHSVYNSLSAMNRARVLAVAKRAKKPPLSDAVRVYLSAIGSIGGKLGGKRGGAIGGKARARNMSVAERREAASAAATQRWSRKTKKQRQAAARKLAKARWSKRKKA